MDPRALAVLNTFGQYNPLVGLAAKAANMTTYFVGRKRQDGQGRRQWGGKRQRGGRAIPYDVDANAIMVHQCGMILPQRLELLHPLRLPESRESLRLSIAVLRKFRRR